MIELLKKTTKPAEGSIKLSFLVSISDILINLFAAWVTGSAVLLSQALQGLSDAVSSALVFFGYHHSRRRANGTHPLGYGREIFFWVLIASIITGGITGVLSILKGLGQIRSPHELEVTFIAIIVLVLGAITNSYSVRSSIKTLVLHKRNPMMFLRRVLGSSFVETKISILIDSLGTFSALVGLVSITLYIATSNPLFDGYGAVAIGTITIIGSMSMIVDIYGLIIGKSANEETLQLIRVKTAMTAGVSRVRATKAVLIGSGLLLVIVDVVFDHRLSALQIEHRSETIRKKLKDDIPGVRHVVVEAHQ